MHGRALTDSYTGGWWRDGNINNVLLSLQYVPDAVVGISCTLPTLKGR